MMIATCPSGECQEYTYDTPTPRPVQIVIHTREAFFECEHLDFLMDEPMPREVGSYTDGYGNDYGWQDSTFPNDY